MIQIDKKLLEELAPAEGVLDGQVGYCMYCYENGEEGVHAITCPWVKVQILLEENK